MRVLIAGCGYVGTRLGLDLASEGVEVTGIRRSPDDIPHPIRPVAVDLLDSGLAPRLPPVDQVVYMASADASAPDAYRRAYVEGPRNLLQALASRGAPVTRVIFVSSTAVYGGAEGGWVDEETPPEPANFRGELMLEGEEVVRNGPFPALSLRLAGIYGPGRDRLVRRVRDGEARCPDPGPIWSNRIHRDDAAGALRHLLRVEDPASCYLGVDDAPTSICEVYGFVAESLGLPAPARDPSASRERANRRCSNRRLRGSGFVFAFPSYREGYRALLDFEGRR